MIVLKQSLSGQTHLVKLREPLKSGTSISVVVTDYDGDEVFSGTATYSAASWTLSAAGGRGTADPKSLSLVAPGIGGSQINAGYYFIVSSGGTFEKVRLVASTTTSATLAASVVMAYPSGSKLYPATATIAFSDLAVSAELSFYCNVSYLTTSNRLVSYNEEGYISANPAQCPVTVEDLLKVFPQLQVMQQVVTFGDELQEKLDSTFDNVRSRLISSNIKPEQFKAVSVLKQVIIYEFALMLAMGGVDPTGQNNVEAFTNRVENILEKKWNELFTTQQFIDVEETGKQTEEQRLIGRSISW